MNEADVKQGVESAGIIITKSEAKQYSRLFGKAWAMFIDRTGLQTVPGTNKFNRFSIDLALHLDSINHVRRAEEILSKSSLLSEGAANAQRENKRIPVGRDPDRARLKP